MHLKGRTPESCTSRSYGARWAWSCWAESARAPAGQKGRWTRTAVAAGTRPTAQIRTHRTATIKHTTIKHTTVAEPERGRRSAAAADDLGVAPTTPRVRFSRRDVEISADRKQDVDSGGQKKEPSRRRVYSCGGRFLLCPTSGTTVVSLVDI